MKKTLTIILLALAISGCVSKGGVFAWTPMLYDPDDNIYSNR